MFTGMKSLSSNAFVSREPYDLCCINLSHLNDNSMKESFFMYENFQTKHLKTMSKFYIVHLVKNWYPQINVIVFST